MSNEVQVRKNGTQVQRASDPFAEMDRLMERFFTEPFSSMFNMPMRKQMKNEIKETKDAYVMRTEVPGIPKEDIKIEINGNLLTIRAEHAESKDNKDEHSEQYRSFQQSFTLPSTVEVSRIEANCENGLLEVLLPKTAAAAAKTVEVQSGKGGFWSRMTGKNEQSDAPKAKNH